MDNQYKKNILNNALLTNSKICLPELDDERIIEASKKLKKLGFNIINFDLVKQKKSIYKKVIKKKHFSDNWTDMMIDEYLESSLNCSMLALDNNDVDCVIAGATHKTSDVIRSAIMIIGIKKNS